MSALNKVGHGTSHACLVIIIPNTLREQPTTISGRKYPASTIGPVIDPSRTIKVACVLPTHDNADGEVFDSRSLW